MIVAYSCTRTKDLPETALKLHDFFEDCNISHEYIVGASSIFDAYSSAVNSLKVMDDDIVILCHDDIIVHSPRTDFLREIVKAKGKNVGFIGVAGTKKLPEHGVWWNSPPMNLSGKVFHVGKDGKRFETNYGPCGRVEVMDGLFLAATKKVLLGVGLGRPECLKEGWDFYDIHYTYKASKMGFDNVTVPIKITHLSLGELVNRPQWFANRKAFLESRSTY